MLLLGRIVAALISGALLAQAYSLHPFWPLAWIAPAPMLIAAIGASRLGAFAYGAIAGLVSVALMIAYFADIGGVTTVLIIVASKALVWGVVAYAVRAAAQFLPNWAAVFLFPALMTGIDTLTAATSPHGSAGALAYSQMDFIPAIQVASLGGAPAITFVVTLLASAIAFLIAKRAAIAALAPALIVSAALGFGYLRTAQPLPSSETIDVTLIAGDQFEGVPDDWRAVWNAYTPQIERAVDDGRRVILLPEKIARLGPGDRAAAIEQLGEIALVPNDSPISKMDLLFYNTLFDENASCHFAFGAAYPGCVKGGEQMSEEELSKAGLNQSRTHVDFMVGTDDLEITGILPDGTEELVFKDGNFVF